jgi:hypothetical protein
MCFCPIECNCAKVLRADANRKLFRSDGTPPNCAHDCYEDITGENNEPLHLCEPGFWDATGFRPAELILHYVINAKNRNSLLDKFRVT